MDLLDILPETVIHAGTNHSDALSGVIGADTHYQIYSSLLRELSLDWSSLTLYQKDQLTSVEETNGNCEVTDPLWQQCLRKAYRCYIDSWSRSLDDSLVPSGDCPVKFDGHQCWPAQAPNIRSTLPCTQAIPATFYQQCQRILPSIDLFSLHAFRECGSDGVWVDDKTDYTACNGYMSECLISDPLHGLDNYTINTPVPDLLDDETKRIMTYLFAGLAVTSLVLLSISLFIFSYFKTLYCNRNSIHKNLIAALMLHVISLLVILSPKISGDDTIYTEAWLCKSFMFLSFYAVPASIMWTFVEGLYLSQRLTLAVFKKEAPFKLYYFIGWGIPLVLASVWALVTELVPYTEVNEAGFAVDLGENKCWGAYSKQPFHWIVTGPCLAALVVNFIFLVMIIIVLVTKLRANNAVETVQVRKAIKATFILVPLLGISNLLFVANPHDNGFGERAYIVVNLILKGSQGIFVALIYCFLNSEVQMAVQKKFYRAALRRNPETQSFRFGSIHNADPSLVERRKSSTRTGSTTVVSSTEVLRSMFRSRRASSRNSTVGNHHNRQRNVSLCNVQYVNSPEVRDTTAADWSVLPPVSSQRPFTRDRLNSSVTFAPGVTFVMHDSSLSDEEATAGLPLSERFPAASEKSPPLPLSITAVLPQKSALSNGHSHYTTFRSMEGENSTSTESHPLMATSMRSSHNDTNGHLTSSQF